MNDTLRFRSTPKPDGEVIQALENALAAARRGDVKTVLILGVNHIHKCESKFAGDLGDINATILIGGMVKAVHELTRTLPPIF